MENMLYGLICLAGTTIGSISGIGGGIIIKPMMDLLSDISATSINFLSGCTVLAMTMIALLRSKNGTLRIEMRRGSFLALGGAAGGVIGKRLFDIVYDALNSKVVGGVQNAVLFLLTIGVFVYFRHKEQVQTRNWSGSLTCIVVGMGLGITGAFLGIGGGPINLVVLSYFFSMDAKTAALNSLYIIFFSQTFNLLSLLYWGQTPDVNPFTLAFMTGGGILGGFLGRSIAPKISNQKTEQLFSCILLLIMATSGYNSIVMFL